MIDLCPVGALTSKPFRYSARTWELSRRKSVSPHDSHRRQPDRPGQGQPGDARRCRWRTKTSTSAGSPTATASPTRRSTATERLTHADDQAGRRSGSRSTGQTALEYVARRPEADQGRARRAEHRRAGVSRTARVEELHLLAKLVRGLGSENIDYRLRHADFAAPARRVALARHVDRLAVEAAARARGRLVPAQGPSAVRAARCARRRARARRCTAVHAVRDDWADADRARASRRRRARWVAGAGRHRRRRSPRSKGVAAPVAGRRRRRGQGHRRLAAVAASARPSCSATRPRSIRRPASCWRWPTGSASRPAPPSATSPKRPTRVGAQLVGALPGAGRPECRRRCWHAAAARRCVLLNTEPVLDAANPAAARAALDGAEHGRLADAVQGRNLDVQPTCCCRSRRSPKRRAPSSTPKAGCRASTAWSSRWARRARPGRCCACSATCSACRASTTRPRKRCAPRRSATSRRCRRACASGARCSGGRCPPAAAAPALRARRRRADLQRRRARAPRAVAAAHRRCAAAGGRHAARAVAAARRRRWRQRARGAGRRRRPCCRRASTRRWPPNVVRVPAGHPATATLGPMFGTDHASRRA